MVGFLKNGYLLGSDVAEDAHRQTGAGEGMAVDEAFGHSELASNCAHFVFEQQAERFAQFQVHALGEAAYVVVALYHRACD